MGNQKNLEHEIRLLRNELEAFKRENQGIAPKNETLISNKYVPPIPPDALRATVSSPSFEGFLFLADLWGKLTCHFLKENSTVLDVGCGCGKLARELIPHPFVKDYIGFDAYKPNIDWCTQYLTPFSQGRFQFYFLDVYSYTFNSKGTIQSTEVKFPAKDNSIDLVVAGSLYTHILEEDACHYLKETFRTLKKGGRFIPSIHNEPTGGMLYSGDEIRVDIDSDYFVQLAERAGLKLENNLGMLAGQEVFLFQKI